MTPYNCRNVAVPRTLALRAPRASMHTVNLPVSIERRKHAGI